MIDIPQGIPSQIIDLAEKNVEQARGAFLGFIGAAQKATDAAETLPSNAKDAMAKAMSFAENNVNAAFDLAQKLVRAKDVSEVLALQSEFAKAQMAAMQTQVKELGAVAQDAIASATQNNLPSFGGHRNSIDSGQLAVIGIAPAVSSGGRTYRCPRSERRAEHHGAMANGPGLVDHGLTDGREAQLLMAMRCRHACVGGGFSRSLRDANDAKGSPFDGNSRSMPTLWRGQALPWLLEAGITLRCCGLEYGFADPVEDLPFFAMTAMSFPVVGLALWFDAAYAPPWWVHLVTTMPLLIVLCALPLRPLKGWLVCSQYFYKAEEGRLAVTNTSSDVDTGRPQARDPGHQGRLSPAKLEGDGALNYGRAASVITQPLGCSMRFMQGSGSTFRRV